MEMMELYGLIGKGLLLNMEKETRRKATMTMHVTIVSNQIKTEIVANPEPFIKCQ